MQRITLNLSVILLLLFIFSCKKDDSNSGTGGPKPVGEATPVGVPDEEAAAVKTIGSEGGSVSSTDGRIRVTIPAGAISSAREVSVRSISNFNPLAIGKAYRLEPHDITFSKPVTVEFNYEEEDIMNTIPEALGIAYQDDKGIWQARGGVVVDKVNQKVRVTTSHFSDWSLFESFYLSTSRSVLPVNGIAELEVFTTADLIVPLTADDEIPMGKKVSMATGYIKQWSLTGSGNLQASGAKAVYKAPSTVPKNINPVSVVVRLDLRQRGTFMLVREIEIVEDDGEIQIRVAGSAWKTKTASPAVQQGDNYFSIADSDGDTEGTFVLVMWEGGVGTHAFKSPEDPTGTYAHYLAQGSNHYVCMYATEEDRLVASGGGVTITSMGEDDGFIKGSFIIRPAGYGDFLRNTIDIEGKFRVRKGW